MSRSFKKVLGHKDHNKWFKKYHQRRLRRYLNNFDNEVSTKGFKFRKFQDVWDWCDWKFLYYSKQSLIASREVWRRTCEERGWEFNDPMHRYYMK